jgi:glycosyltransferase involved in cell wall biosynthesis
VISQTYTDWEIIVADDGSTDDTARLATDADERVRVVKTPGRSGPAAARNTALAHATGELVAFLDADDLLLPRFLERQIALYDERSARSGPPVGLVACNALLRTPDGNLPITYFEQFRSPPVEPLTLERVIERNCIYVSTVVPRALGESLGWFAPELFGTEDHDLWIRIMETGGRVVVNPEVLAVYRLSAGSVSSKVSNQAANNQLTYTRALARGRLSARQARVAKKALRYSRAMEAVAGAWMDRDARRLVRSVPVVIWVALTNPRHWGEWWRELRGRGVRGA